MTMNYSIDHLKAKSHFLMIMFSILISGSFIFGSFVANKIDPSAISAIRFVFAFLILFLILKSKKKTKSFLVVKFYRYVLLGGLIATYFVMMFEGLKTASPIAMSAIMALTPFLTIMLEYIFYRKKIEIAIALSLVIGAIGSLWIIFDANLNQILNFDIGKGESLFLIGCSCQAIYTLLIPILNEGETTLEQTSNTMLVSAILLIMIDFKAIASTSWNEVTLDTWLTILYLSVFATAIAFFIIQYARNFLPTTYIMAYYYTVPMWVLIFETIIFGTFFRSELWLGCFAIIFAFSTILLKDTKLRLP